MAQQLPPGAEKEQAVTWLSDVSPKDVAAVGNRFDAWLRRISGNHITFEDVKTFAGAVPIVGNIMAMVDALGDIAEIIEKRGGQVLDYMSLAINLLGIIPIPPTLAPFRMSARPLLALVRHELLATRNNLGAAIVSVLVTHINATCATEIEDFLNKLKAGLVELLDGCAFDPASNIIDPVRTTEMPASRPSPVRPESTLPVEVPKVLGNLLKAYAGTHFEYDARGNLVRKRTPAGEQEYEWDECNRLLSARVAETSRQSQARYFYDAFGRRIAKEVNGERTVFGWDGDTLAYESDSERGTHYLYEPGKFVPLAQYVAEPVEGIATPEWKSTDRYVPEEDPLQKMPERRGGAVLFYYHCDQIGTPQLLTDDNGDVVWEASYKAWGEAREVIARASKAAGIVAKNSLRFQGQRVDDETGLHYNRHRYYDPSTGRFVSKDPIGLLGGPNPFAYVPSPTQWTDPLGLAACKCDPCGIAAHGDQPTPRPTGLQSHHIIQDAWAQANVSGYSRGSAPAILLPQSPDHSTITALQNARRDTRVANGQPKWGTSMDEEFGNSYRDLGAAGVSEKCRRKAIKRAYKHFYGE